MDQRATQGRAAQAGLAVAAGPAWASKVGRVLVEPLGRGVVALWLQIGPADCLVIESGTPEWETLFAGAGVEAPSDFDAAGDLGEAVRQLRGTIIDVAAVAA